MANNPNKGLKSIPSYIKNVTKSTMYAGGDFIGDIMPATKSFASSNSNVFKIISNDIRNFRSVTKQVGRQMGQSEMYKTAKKYRTNLVDDLKTGNWVNRTREDKYNMESSGFGDMFDSSDFDFSDFGSFDEEDNGDSLGLSVTKGDALTVNAIASSSNAMMGMTSSVGQAISETTAKSADMITKNQQNIYTMNTVNNYRMFNEINGVLGDMGNNIRGLFEYTKNTTDFYNSTLKLNEDMSNKMMEMVALNKEATEMQRNQYKEYSKSKETKFSKAKHDEVFDSYGGMDIAKYGEYVTKNAKEAWEGSMVGSQMNMFGEGTNPLLAFAGSPLSFLPKMLIKKMAPKALKGSMGTLDKTMAGFSKSAMLKMSSKLKQQGETNPIFDTLYKVFGLDVGNTSTMKTGQFVKGPVPLDGIMRQSIIEVIPGYLRVIAAAVSGNSEKTYNYDTGKFEEMASIVKRRDTVNNGAYTKVDDTAYKVKNAMDQSFEFDREMNTAIKKDTDKFFKFLADKGFFYNPRSTSYSDLNEQGLYLDNDKSFDMIQGILKTMGPNTWQELNEQIIDTVEYSKSYFADINSKLTESGLSAAENGLTDVNKLGKNQFKPIDKFNKSSLDYLRDIRSILLEGIKVFVAGNIGDGGDSSILDTRMSKYNETVKADKNKVLPFNEADAIARAKKDKKQYMSSFDDIELDPAKLEAYLATKYDPNNLRRISEEEQKALDLKDAVSKTSLGSSFGKLKKVGGEVLSAPGKVISSLMDSVNSNINDFLYGKENGEKTSMFDNMSEKLSNGIDKVSVWLNDKIVEPLNTALFDPTTGIMTRLKSSLGGFKLKAFGVFSDGSSRGGWFSPVINGFLDTKDMMANVFMGKAYTNRTTGAKINKRETTVFGEIKNMFNGVVTSVKGDPDKGGPSLKEKIIENVSIQTAKFSNSMFGTDLDKMTPSDFYNTHVKSRVSKMGLGATAGLALSFMTPLGLLGGTLLGGGLGTLSTSERFKTMMFGRVGEDGSRVGGKVPKEYMDTLKNATPSIYKGLGIGALAALFTPLGLVGGTLLGGGLGFASTTESVKGVLFGKMGADGKRDEVNGIINKEFRDKLKIKLPGMAKGAGLGLIGSFFLPGGPIVGSMMGLASGIAMQSDSVKNMLFGKLDPATESRNGGLFGKFKVWFKGDVMGPMKAFMGDLRSKGVYWFEKSIVNPLLESFAPLKQQAIIMKDNFMANMKAGFESTKNFVGGMFETHVGKPFGVLMEEKFINPLKTFFKNTFGKLGKAFLNVLAAPFAGINKVAMGYKDQHIKDGKAGYLDDWKAKKSKRDKATQDKFDNSQKGVKGDKSRLKLIKKLLLAGNYDPNHPATIKAMGMMNGINIKNPLKGKDPKAPNISESIIDISDNSNKTNDILSDISSWLKNVFDFNKPGAKTKKDKLFGLSTVDTPKPDKGINIKNPSKSGFKVKGDKSEKIQAIDLDDPNLAKEFKDANSPTLILKLYDKINSIYKTKKPKHVPLKHRNNIPDNSGNSVIDSSDDSEEGESRSTNIKPIKNKSRSMASSLSDISSKTNDIYSELKGQITNVGYNTEMIANILVEKFGKPSMLPKGIRGGAHFIKSKLGGPFKFLQTLISAPFKAIGSLIKPVTSVIGETIKAIASVPKAILGVFAEIAKGAASLINTAFKAIPAMINVVSTAVVETTKVLGAIGVEVAKGVGGAMRLAGKAVGELASGILSLTTKALPMAFKAIGFIAKASMGVVSGLTSMAGNIMSVPFKAFGGKGKNKLNGRIDNIKNIETIETVKLIEKIDTVNKVEALDKINDPRIYNALSAIKNAVSNSKSDTNDSEPVQDETNNPFSPIINTVIDMPKIIKDSVKDTFKSINSNKNIKSVETFKQKEKDDESELNNKKLNVALYEGAKADKGVFDILSEATSKKGIFGKLFAIVGTIFGALKTFGGKAIKWGTKLFKWITGGEFFKGLIDGVKKLFPKAGGEVVENVVKEGTEAVVKEGAEAVAKKGALNATGHLVTNGTKNAALNAASNAIGKNVVKEGAEAAAKSGGVALTSNLLTSGAENIVEASYNVVDDVAKATSKSAGKSVAKIAAQGAAEVADVSIIKKIFSSGALKKLAGPTIGPFLGEIAEAISKKMAKAGAAVFAKIAAKWGVMAGAGAVSGGIVPAIWYGGSIINGVSATNRMFDVSPNYKPSMLMRTVAGFSGFISEFCTIGFVPADWICNLISSLVISESEALAMQSGKDELKAAHEAYVAETGNEIKFEDYNKKIANRSLMTKTVDGAKNIGHVATLGMFDSDKIREMYGLEEGEKVSLGKRVGAAGANLTNALTFGKVDQKQALEAFSKVGEKAGELYTKSKDFIFSLDDKFLDAMDTTNATIGAIFGLTDDEGNPLNFTDWSKGKFKAMGESIKSFAKSATDGAKELWGKTKDTFNKGKENVGEAIGVFDNNIGSMFGLVDENGNSIKLTEWVGGKAKSAMDSISGVVDSAVKGAKEVWSGISNMYESAKQKVKDGASKFNNKIGSMLGLEDSDGESTSATGWVSDKWNGFKDSINIRKKRGGKGGQGGRGGMTGPDTKNNAAYFSQHDPRWGKKMYLPNENISQAGCGPTSAAMVLSSVTGQTITPDTIADYSVQNGFMHPDLGTSWGLFPSIGQKYGIGLQQTNYDSAATALTQGRPVIFSGQGPAPYTSGGHFVVGVGMTPDGKVIINDPNKAENSTTYDYDSLLQNTAGAWESTKSLTGGVVATGDMGSVPGGEDKKQPESAMGRFTQAIADIGSLTAGLVGSTFMGEVFDPNTVLHPEANNSTNPNGSNLDGFTPISSDMDFDFNSIASVGTSKNSNKTYGRDAIRETPGGNAAFINAIAPQAVKSQADFGIPASTVIAQAILESGWGRSTIGNNVFGIKEGSGYQGPVVSTKTNENYGGQNVSITDTFRGYNSISEGVYDHAKNVIAGNPQYYSGVITKDWRQSIRGLSPSYATDPNYVSKLESTINANDLTKYNNMSPTDIGGRGNGIKKPKSCPNFKMGGRGGITAIKEQRINMQQVIADSLRNANNEINDILTAQTMTKNNTSNTSYDMMLRLLQQITDNTSVTAQNTKELIDKEYCVNVEQQQTSIPNNEQSKEQTKEAAPNRENAFSRLVNKNGNKSLGSAYTKAREYAVGHRD